MRNLFLIIFTVLLLSACSIKNDYDTVFKNPELYSKAVADLTKVITHDIFTPPVASRIYAYSNIAAYEVMAGKSTNFKSLSTKLTGLKSTPFPDKEINAELSALLALSFVGQELTFSKDSAQKIIDGHIQLAQNHGMPQQMIEESQK